MRAEQFTKPNGSVLISVGAEPVFVPKSLPPQIYYDNELINMLSKAESKVGELKGIGELLSSPNTLIRPYLRREAVISSKIEGTLASIEDVLQYEAIGNIGENESERLRLREVINYVRAVQDNLVRIKNGEKITREMIKRAHGRLMLRVRGYSKKPGEFRTFQNWIVPYGESAKNSVYTPPPPESLDDLLENLENFLINPPENMPVLIQCAIMHYQFEAIHPFADGNGRIGRVLISLLLAEKGVLPQPLLYLSAFFEKNIKQYYNGLLAISQKSKWREWLKFFLLAITEQADATIKNIYILMQLQKKYKEKLMEKRASGSAVLLVDYLFENPYITIPRAQAYLRLSYPSAKRAVERLVDVAILEEARVYSRGRVFLAREIVDSLKSWKWNELENIK